MSSYKLYIFFTVKENENIHGVQLAVSLIFFTHSFIYSSNMYKYILCRKHCARCQGVRFQAAHGLVGEQGKSRHSNPTKPSEHLLCPDMHRN